MASSPRATPWSTGTILPWQRLRVNQSPSAPCVIALHGMFGEPRDWKLVASRLSVDASFDAVALAPLAQLAPLDLTAAAGAVARTVRAIRSARPDAPLVFAGYSFGGRLAAAATALLAPDALVLVSARVFPLPPDAARTRRRDDLQLGDALLRDGMVAFLREWQQRPMFAGLVARGLAGAPSAGRAAACPSWARLVGALSPGRAMSPPDLRRARRVWCVVGRDDAAYVCEAKRFSSLRPHQHHDVAIVDAGDGLPTTHSLLVEAPAAVAQRLDYACTP